MHKIIYLIIISLFLVIPSGVYAIDEIEKEYIAQLEYLNNEIISTIAEAMEKIETIESVVSFKNIALERGISDNFKIAEAKEEKTNRELYVIKDRLNFLKTKREQLKTTVLEKYGSLPDWWVEHAIDKQLCSLSPPLTRSSTLHLSNLLFYS